MSSEMKKWRKEDLSLYYYIKDVVLADFIEQETRITIRYMSEISSTNSFVYEALTEMIPKPTDRGRGWVYFDEGFYADCTCNTCSGIVEQSNRVRVYSCTLSGNTQVLTPISDREYMVDYIDGRIVTSGTVTPAFADYYWNYVSVVDEWSAVQAANPPVVVIDMMQTDKAGYQLGGGKKVVRKVDLHIFASCTAERNDIAETLYDGLYNRSAPLYDFPQGGVLDYDGTFYGRRRNMNKAETPFDNALEGSVIGNLEFENVTARHVNLPLLMTRSTDEVMLSDLNAYRSKVSFELTSYTYYG
jgi:hypothetical protein